MSRFRRSGGKLAILAASIVAMVVSSLTAAVAFHEEGHTVTICHATGSATNPYNVIHTDEAATGGHLDNEGNPEEGHEEDFVLDDPDATPEECEEAAGGDDTGGDDTGGDDGGEEYPPKE